MNFKIKYSAFLLILPIFALISCEEVINIDLNSSSPKIVVEGHIAKDSLCILKLSYTADYFDNSEPIAVTDATVTLTSNIGEGEVLNNLGNGEYRGSTIYGSVNTTYSLSIDVAGETITGYTTLFPPTAITAIEANPIPFVPPGFDPPLILTIRFVDNPAIDNYYMLKIYRNDTLMTGSVSLTTDEFITSNEVEYTEWRFDFIATDSAKVEIFSIDKDLYRYFSMLNDVTSSGINFSTPYNPRSNLTSGALGYFGSWSFVSDSLTIQ
jgi:hypothetical protein